MRLHMLEMIIGAIVVDLEGDVCDARGSWLRLWLRWLTEALLL